MDSNRPAYTILMGTGSQCTDSEEDPVLPLLPESTPVVGDQVTSRTEGAVVPWDQPGMFDSPIRARVVASVVEDFGIGPYSPVVPVPTPIVDAGVGSPVPWEATTTRDIAAYTHQRVVMWQQCPRKVCSSEEQKSLFKDSMKEADVDQPSVFIHGGGPGSGKSLLREAIIAKYIMVYAHKTSHSDSFSLPCIVLRAWQGRIGSPSRPHFFRSAALMSAFLDKVTGITVSLLRETGLARRWERNELIRFKRWIFPWTLHKMQGRTFPQALFRRNLITRNQHKPPTTPMVLVGQGEVRSDELLPMVSQVGPFQVEYIRETGEDGRAWRAVYKDSYNHWTVFMEEVSVVKSDQMMKVHQMLDQLRRNRDHVVGICVGICVRVDKIEGIRWTVVLVLVVAIMLCQFLQGQVEKK